MTTTAACLGLGRSIPRCPTWRPIQRRSFEPVGQKEPILRQQTLTQMWSPQFSPDPRIPGIGLAFSCTTSTAAESSAITGTCPGSPSHCFSPTAKSASSCSPTRRPCSARICSPRRAFARGLVCRRRAPGCRALMCLSVRISEGPGFLMNVPSRRLRRGARLTLWRDDPRSFQLNADGTSLDASGSLMITFTGAPRIYFPSIERRGSIDLMVVHRGPGSLCL